MKHKTPPHLPLTNARLSIVQALYVMEFEDVPLENVAEDFLALRLGGEVLVEDPVAETEHFEPLADTDFPFFSSVLTAYQAHAALIDGKIKASLSAKWPFERLDLLLLAILRAGIAEMYFDPAKDKPIIVHEYTQIAYDFFPAADAREPKMINAVLDKAAKG